MRYFAGLDVSLEETAICVVDETGRIASSGQRAGPAGSGFAENGSAAGAHRFGSLLSNGVAIRKAEACRAAGDLHRSPSGQCSDEDNAEQDGPQRCPGSGTDHANGLVPGGACQEPAMSVLAFASGRPPHGPQRDALYRERGAGDPEGSRHQARHAVSNRLCRSRPRTGQRRRLPASTAHHCATANPASETTGFLAWGGEPA